MDRPLKLKINENGLYTLKINRKTVLNNLTYSELNIMSNELIRELNNPDITKLCRHILDVVSSVTGISKKDIVTSTSRKLDIVGARHLVHFFENKLKDKDEKSLITFRTKGTVINSVNIINNVIEFKSPVRYYKWYLDINSTLNNSFNININEQFSNSS